MQNQFTWLDVRTEYNETRPSQHGDDVRWIVNRETIANTATGETVTRGTIRHPGICVIVPFLTERQVVLMRQYRYAVDERLWELPAGTLTGRLEGARVVPTETPDACAARELLEETGYRARELNKVGECYAMPGMSDERIHIFIARHLVHSEQALDLGEIIEEVRPFSLADLDAMIGRGDIRDAKTLIGIFYALRGTSNGLPRT